MFYSIFLCVLLSLYCKNRVLQYVFREKPVVRKSVFSQIRGRWQIHCKFLRRLERDVLGLDGVREKDRGRIGEFLCRLSG